MWKKLLKCREIAKSLYQVEVRNGKKISFWFEAWSSLDCLHEVLSGRGHIDMSILANETVEACRNHRKRYHRAHILNTVELEIEKFKESWVDEKDVSLWRNGKGKYKNVFSTCETWHNIREKHQLCSWHPAVWFKHATPKYAFVTWMVIQGRLSTGDRMIAWNVNADGSCVLCRNPLETAMHLFCQCPYSMQIWEALMKGVLRDQFTVDWESLVRLTTINQSWSKVKLFVIRYMMQSAVHTIWMEGNRRRHNESPSPSEVLVKRLDKNMRKVFHHSTEERE